jgi:hypothetical protein
MSAPSGLEAPAPAPVVHPLALRVGVGIWLFSWIPLAGLLGLHAPERQVVWILQFLIGLVGIAIAGKTFFDVAKQAGWRRTPRIMWSAFIHGRATIPAEPHVEP